MPLKPVPLGFDPSPIHHSKANELLYMFPLSDLPDEQLACLRSVTYLRQASRRPGSSKRLLPSLKSSRTSFFPSGDSGRKQGFWNSRTADACLQFHHLLFSLVVMLMSTSKTITVERFDLSLGLTHLFCQNSDYETLRLINDGINLEKKTAIGILQVFCASQS